jgi:hypothetical protein
LRTACGSDRQYIRLQLPDGADQAVPYKINTGFTDNGVPRKNVYLFSISPDWRFLEFVAAAKRLCMQGERR